MNANNRPAENLRRDSGASGSGSNSTPVYCDSVWGEFLHKPEESQVEATHFCYQCENFYLCPDCLEEHKEAYAAHKTSTKVYEANAERMRLKLYGKAMPASDASKLVEKRLVYNLDEENRIVVAQNFPFVQQGRRVPMITLLGKTGVGKSTIAAHLVHEDEAKAGFVPIVAERGEQSTTMGVTYFKGQIGDELKMDVDVLDFEGLGGSEKTYVEMFACKVPNSIRFERLAKYARRPEAVKAYLLPLAYLLADAVIMVMPQAALAEECEEFLTYLSKMSKQQVQHEDDELPHLVIIFNQSAGEFQRPDVEEAVCSQLQERFSSVRCYTLPNFKDGLKQPEEFSTRLTAIQENLRVALQHRVQKADTASRHVRPYRMEDMFYFIVPRLPPYLQEKDQPIMLHSLIPGNVATDWHLRFADDFNERFIKQINIPALAKNELLKPLLLVARSMMVFRMCSYQLLAQQFRYSSQSPKAHQFNEGMNSIIECIENRLPCSAGTEYEYMRKSNPKCGSLRGGHGKQHQSEGRYLKRLIPFFQTLFTDQAGFDNYFWPEQGGQEANYTRHTDILTCFPEDDSQQSNSQGKGQLPSAAASSQGGESSSQAQSHSITSEMKSSDLFSGENCKVKPEQLKLCLSQIWHMDTIRESILKELHNMPKKSEFISFLSSQKQTLSTDATSTTQSNPSSPEHATPKFFQNCCSLCLTQDNLKKIQCEKKHQVCGNCKLVVLKLEICWICGSYGKKSPQPDTRGNPTQSSSKASTLSFVKAK